jgi:hypothetical protein
MARMLDTVLDLGASASSNPMSFMSTLYENADSVLKSKQIRSRSSLRLPKNEAKYPWWTSPSWLQGSSSDEFRTRQTDRSVPNGQGPEFFKKKAGHAPDSFLVDFFLF